MLRVYKDGKLVAENGKVIFEKAAETPEWDAEIKKRVFHSFHCRPIQSSDLALTKKENQIRVLILSVMTDYKRKNRKLDRIAWHGSWSKSGEGCCKACGVGTP